MNSQSSVIALGTQLTHYHTLAKEIPLILYHFLVDTDLSSTIIAIHAYWLFIITYLVTHPYVYLTFLLSLINVGKKAIKTESYFSLPSYIFPLFYVYVRNQSKYLNKILFGRYTHTHTHTHTLVGQNVESMNEM